MMKTPIYITIILNKTISNIIKTICILNNSYNILYKTFYIWWKYFHNMVKNTGVI